MSQRKKQSSLMNPISNAKITENIVFCPELPVLEFHQNISNSCCLSSLASDFHIIENNRVLNALMNRTGEPLTIQTDKSRNRIYFDNDIMKT